MSSVTESTLVPPLRLGRLLREQRELAGKTLRELGGGGLGAELLEDVEAGRADLSLLDLTMIASLYGVDVSHIVPQRMELVIDLHHGRMSLADREIDVETDGSEDVLVRYLALLYAIRGMPIGTPVPLRRIDLDVLSQALEVEVDDIQERLHTLMLDPSDELHHTARRFRQRLVVPVVGLLVGVTALGAVLFVNADHEVAPTPAPAGVVAYSDVEIGDPMVVTADTGWTVEVEIGEAIVGEIDPATGEYSQRPR